MKTLYLNDNGTRWINIDSSGQKEKIRVSGNGVSYRDLTVVHWEQCGNSAYPTVKLDGSLVNVYPDHSDPVVWMPYKVKYEQYFGEGAWSELETM